MSIHTKRQFCEEVLRDYYGGDISSDADRDPREILFMFYELIPYFAKKNAFDNSNADAALYVDGQLIVSQSYTQILKDPIRDEKYIELLSLPVALPKNMGINEVRPLGVKYRLPFIIGQSGQASLMGSLPGGKLINRCYPEGTRLYFPNMQANINKVLVKLAGAVDTNLDMDTPLGILGEYVPEAKQLVMDRLAKGDARPKDTINDGNDQ